MTLFLAVSLLSLPDASLDPFLAEWAARMEGLRTLEVRFRQEKRLKVLLRGRPLLSRGTIRLDVGERRLRSTVLDPQGRVESEILAEKDAVRILYPPLKRLEVYELGEGAAPPVSFPGLGGDVKALKRDYQLALERSPDGDRLTLTPRDPASSVRELRLVMKDFVVKELYQVEKSGDSIRMTIEEFRKNPPLRAEDLKLEIPPGTEEVRPLGKKRGGPPAGAGGAPAPGPPPPPAPPVDKPEKPPPGPTPGKAP